MVRYLQNYTEARRHSDLVAEEEMSKSRAAEQAAMLAETEAKADEPRALALAHNVTTTPAKKITPRRPTNVAAKEAVGEPLQLVQFANAAMQTQPVVQVAALPAGSITPAAHNQQTIIKTKLHQVTAMMERVPLLVHSVSDWISSVPSRRVLQLRIGIS